MIYDTHAHLDDSQFDEDRENLIQQLKDQGTAFVINNASDMDSIRKTLNLVKEHSFIYGALGIHPSDCGDLTEEGFSFIKENITQDKIVAVGEIGLDYYWKEPERSIQKTWFERQLLLAKEKKKPVVIHSRDAAKDTVDIMKEMKAGEIGGEIHCFSYGTSVAKEFLDMGFYFGIGGVVTFKNAKKLHEVVAYLPLTSILLETDCPYLAPVPERGKRNSPLNIPLIAREVAAIKGITYEEVMDVTSSNARKLFGIRQ